MEKRKLELIVFLLIFLIGFSLALVSQADSPMKRKIVILDSKFLNEKTFEELINQFGGVLVKNLDLIGAKVVLLPPKAEKALAKISGILRIEDDVEVFALTRKTLKIPSQPVEILPWGIDKIDAEKVWGGNEDATEICKGCITGKGIKVAILDTGIDLSHPNLRANIKGGINTINPKKSYNDDNGHGTHVAGIVAALENKIGVIGASPEIELYSVKVLNAAGIGYLSDIIEGLEWVIQQKELYGGYWIVNMSFGTPEYSVSFEQAINKVDEAGIVQIAAAGNSGPAENTILYPAKFDKVIAVSAIDENNTIANWSSRGEEVDLAAPGVNIYSTYKNSSYKTLSGTSMAAPHVSGVAALLLSNPEKCDFNKDGKCSPSEVQKRLEETAIDLGDEGEDNLYGSGLVNAERALFLSQ